MTDSSITIAPSLQSWPVSPVGNERRYLSDSISVMSWMGDSIKPCLE